MTISELFDSKTKTPSSGISGLNNPSAASALSERASRAVPGSGFMQREIHRAATMQRLLGPVEQLYKSVEFSMNLPRWISAELQAVQREAQSYVDRLLESSRQATAIFNTHLVFQSEFLRWLEPFTCDDLFPELENFLIQQGWYLSADLSAGVVFKLSDWFDEGELDKIEHGLRGFYHKRTAGIERSVVQRFPKRQRLLTAAFRAHRARDYALSVPAFLTQVDGISRDLWRANFFRSSQSNRSINRLVRDGRVPPLSATLRRQLLEPGSIRASSNGDGEGLRFNRHAILHGNDTEFDREEYSLRCIALLDFMVSLCPLFEPN
jgi:hypothetical protein